MKRSDVNEIMAAAEEMIAAHGFKLPPFAWWSAEAFQARRGAAARMIEARVGWDITDYGLGRFDEVGLFLFTLRNGDLADLRRGGGMCYAEKLLISKRDHRLISIDEGRVVEAQKGLKQWPGSGIHTLVG